MRVSTIGNNLCFEGSALTARTVEIFLHLVLVLVTSVLINMLRSFVDHRALPAQETQEVLGQFLIAKLIVKMLFKREN